MPMTVRGSHGLAGPRSEGHGRTENSRKLISDKYIEIYKMAEQVDKMHAYLRQVMINIAIDPLLAVPGCARRYKHA